MNHTIDAKRIRFSGELNPRMNFSTFAKVWHVRLQVKQSSHPIVQYSNYPFILSRHGYGCKNLSG